MSIKKTKRARQKAKCKAACLWTKTDVAGEWIFNNLKWVPTIHFLSTLPPCHDEILPQEGCSVRNRCKDRFDRLPRFYPAEEVWALRQVCSLLAVTMVTGPIVSEEDGSERNMASTEPHRRSSTGSECRDKTNDRLRKEHFLLPNSDQIDLNLLLQAVLDINEKLNEKPTERSKTEETCGGPTSKDDRQSTQKDRDFDDTASRHSSVSSASRSRPRSAVHLNESRRPRPLDRKNMSFSNATVDAIDRENKRLLKEITRNRGRPKSAQPRKLVSEPLRVQTSSEVNRYRFQRKVDMENQVSITRSVVGALWYYESWKNPSSKKKAKRNSDQTKSTQ